MAKLVGQPSRYIRENVFKNGLFYLSLSVLCVVGAMLTYGFGYFTYGKDNAYTTSVFLIVYLFVLWAICRTLMFAFDKDTYLRGRTGEEAIRDEIGKLSSSYTCFWGTKIIGTKYDVDFVVVGPTGIFTIDSKNIHGFIGYKYGKITQNGFPMRKNILWQAQQEARFIQGYLRDTLNIYIPVNPIVCFSSPLTRLKFGLKPIEGVTVIGKKWLTNFINSKTPYKLPIDIKLIEKELEKICISS